MKKQQSGFTLIELIMVIVVLGILAAFALPRFANLSTEARVSAVQGAAGAIKSAAAIAHSASLAGQGSATSVTLEGQAISMVNGYPDSAGILLAAQITSNDFDVKGIAGSPATVTAKNVATANTANCQVKYAEAAANAAPTITVDTSKCE